jgi:hypothetical protein
MAVRRGEPKTRDLGSEPSRVGQPVQGENHDWLRAGEAEGEQARRRAEDKDRTTKVPKVRMAKVKLATGARKRR